MIALPVLESVLESVSDSLCAETFSCPVPDVYPVSFLRAI